MMVRAYAYLREMGPEGLKAATELAALRTTLAGSFGQINAANLKRAHALIESGRAKGKITLEGFGE